MRKVTNFDELNIVLRELLDFKSKQENQSLDRKGNRVANMGDAKEDSDAVTLRQLKSHVGTTVQEIIHVVTGSNNPSSGGSGGGSIPPPADLAPPNVASVNEIALIQTGIGNVPTFVAEFTVIVNPNDINYGNLASIRISVQPSDESVAATPLGQINKAQLDSSGSVTFFTNHIANEVYSKQYTFTFSTISTTGREGSTPYLYNLVVGGAQTGFTPGPTRFGGNASITNVACIESANSRVADKDGSTRYVLDVNIAFSSSSNNTVTVWISENDATYDWINWYDVSGSNVTIHILDRVVPQDNSLVKVKVKVGAIQETSDTTGATESAATSILGYQPASAVGITSITLPNYPNTSSFLKYGKNSVGQMDYGFYGLQMTLPENAAIGGDPYFFEARFTVQEGYSSSGLCTVTGGTTITITTSPGMTSADVGKTIHINGNRSIITGYISNTKFRISPAVPNLVGASFVLWNPASSEFGGTERQFADSMEVTGHILAPGATIFFHGPGAADAWTNRPTNINGVPYLYRSVRLTVYAVSRKTGTNPAQMTDTASANWYNTPLDYFEFTPDPQPSTLDLGVSAPNSMSGGILINQNSLYRQLVTTNSTLSGMQNWGFEYSADGQISADDQSWGILGSDRAIRSDGGSSGLRYARITDASSGIYDKRGINVTPGDPVYLAASLRSSNTAGIQHYCSGFIEFFDQNGAFITALVVTIVSGYLAAWTQDAVAGIVIAPAGSAIASAFFQLSSLEPAGGYFDVDDVKFQAVTNQEASNILQSLDPGSSFTTNPAISFNSVTSVAQASFGTKNFYLIDTTSDVIRGDVSDASTSTLLVQTTTGTVQQIGINTSNTGSVVQAVYNAGSGVPDAMEINVASGNPKMIATVAGVGHSGVTETLAAAIAGARHVIGGIIVP